MGKSDKRIDAYIGKSADFAKPVLEYIRETVHKACPDIEETIKWGFPHFDYKGMLCSMAAFKAHCALGFWKVSLMKDEKKLFEKSPGSPMGAFGKITSVKDLPSENILIKYIKEAVKLNDDDVKLPSRERKSEKNELEVPDYFMKALKKNKSAFRTFENFRPSHKKEYIQWVTGAKTEETRLRRLETAIEWMSEGKSQNWRYEKK